jgi:hypothetical protein
MDPYMILTDEQWKLISDESLDDMLELMHEKQDNKINEAIVQNESPPEQEDW